MPSISPLSIVGTFKQICINTVRLIRIAWGLDKKYTVLFYGISFVGALVPVVTSYLLAMAIDKIQIAQGDPLAIIPVIVVAALVVRSTIYVMEDIVYNSFARTYLDHIFRYKIQNKISYDFYKTVGSLDMGQIESSDTQNLIAKVKDMMLWKITDFIRTSSYLFSNVVTFLSAFIVVLKFGWWIPLIITVVTIPRLYIRTKFGNIQWSAWEGNIPESKKLWYLSWILQDKVAVREMKIALTQETILSKFKGIQEFIFEKNKKPLDMYMKTLIVPPMLEALVILFITLVFLPDVVSQVITIGAFSLLLTMTSQLNHNTASAAYNVSELYENNLYVNQYFELLALRPEIVSKPDAHNIVSNSPPKIEFKNVSFTYSKGKKILHDVSFVIEPGQSVAFVGHNGAGKSTIIKLLCRFYDVTAGEILINGVNIKDVNLQSWYTYMGTLFQEFVWYHLTIRENITLGSRTTTSEKEIINAAKKAGAHDFIMKLPQKYDQPLGREYENGEELSGGQWQKLAIARAFYQQPPILILDEPTSAIDAEAEYEIFTNLEKHYADNKSLILVSHRFSTVRNAEKIIVLEDGKVTEQGTHTQLLKKKGTYARMFLAQAEGYN
ncbi:ABC transporter ATP-binding protein [Candidatus Woesebacteria bacterium]|nr:ABC transporter ATP-binding protein [Candidatus Woesebacteria bacterium]